MLEELLNDLPLPRLHLPHQLISDIAERQVDHGGQVCQDLLHFQGLRFGLLEAVDQAHDRLLASILLLDHLILHVIE